MTFQEREPMLYCYRIIGKQDENICWQIEKATFFHTVWNKSKK